MQQRSERKTAAIRYATRVWSQTTALLVSLGAMAGCGSSSDDGNNNARAAHRKMLESLNVDTDLGPRQSPQGEPLSESEHPTGEQHASFSALTEVFVGDTANNQVRLLQESLRTVSGSGDTTSADLTDSTAAAGKFDGDALDEIVHVGRYEVAEDEYELVARFMDDLSAAASGALDETRFPIAENLSRAQLASAAGNFDNDANDEIAVAYGRTVYLLDDREARLNLLQKHRISEAVPGSVEAIAALPMTAESGDDLFIVTGVEPANDTSLRDKDAHYFEVLDTNGFNSIDSGRLEIESQAGRTDIHVLHGLQVGEIDPVSETGSEFTDVGAAAGAPADELIITGQRIDETADPTEFLFFAAAFRPNDNGGIQQVGYRRAAFKSGGGRIYSLPFVPVDVDGDRTDELFNPYEGRFEVRLTGEVVEVGGIVYSTDTAPQSGRSAPIAVGNFTGDTDSERTFKEDVLLYDENMARPVVYGVNVDPTTPAEGVQTWSPSEAALDVTTTSGSQLYVTANMDEDSDVLRFERHELAFSNPQVLAVMSAPPFYANTGQTNGNIDTSFGQGQGTTSASTQSIGVSAGITFGATAEAPIFGSTIGEFKTTLTTTTTYNQSFGTTTSVSKRVAWTTGSEDKVLFTAVPYDVYYYEIVKSADPEARGTTMRVSVPREPITQAVPLELYNQNNGDNPDVTVLNHTVGDPKTYPDRINAIHPGEPSGYRVGPFSVGLSSADNLGSLNLEISESKGESTSAGVNLSVSVETEAVIAGVVGGAQFGLSYGYTHTESVTKSTTFSGTIPDIPLNDGSPAADEYKVGLYVFEATHSIGEDGTNSFPVISYWVELQ